MTGDEGRDEIGHRAGADDDARHQVIPVEIRQDLRQRRADDRHRRAEQREQRKDRRGTGRGSAVRSTSLSSLPVDAAACARRTRAARPHRLRRGHRTESDGRESRLRRGLGGAADFGVWRRGRYSSGRRAGGGFGRRDPHREGKPAMKLLDAVRSRHRRRPRHWPRHRRGASRSRRQSRLAVANGGGDRGGRRRDRRQRRRRPRLRCRRHRPRRGGEDLRRDRARTRIRQPADQQRRRLLRHRPDLEGRSGPLVARRRDQYPRLFPLLPRGAAGHDRPPARPDRQSRRRRRGDLLSQWLGLRDQQGRPAALHRMPQRHARRHRRAGVRDGSGIGAHGDDRNTSSTAKPAAPTSTPFPNCSLRT